jgi:hypothetical protein
MKNIIIFGLVVFLISCTESIEEVNQNERGVGENTELRSSSLSQFERGGISYARGNISVTCSTAPCSGNNTGHTDHCQVASDMNGRFECTCSGCSMTITFDSYNSGIDAWEQIYREDLHLEDFEAFTQRKHGERLRSFNRVDFNFQPNATTIVYTYELANGSEESVMYATTYTSEGFVDKRYEIDCNGECECREIFDFNTNKAECSCSPCKMTVSVFETK